MMSMQLPKNMAIDMRAKVEKEKKDKEQRGFFAKLLNRDKKDQEKKKAQKE